jgi:3-oxoacyl-[acyl-carrier-protein] synthase-3
MDWQDRTTCVLFGDGAGAVVLAASQVPGGIMSYMLGADGSGADYLIMPGGGSRHPTTHETVEQRMHYIKMNGREVFKFATRAMDRATRLVCERANVPLEHVELVVPHQANDRIIQAAAKSLGLMDSAFYVNLDRYGNTSAASIPIALCEVLEKGLVRRHDHVVLVGFGAGLTWGALLLQWETPFPAVTLKWWQRLYNAVYYRWAQLRSWLARLRRRVEGWQTRENGNGDTARKRAASSRREAATPLSDRPGAREEESKHPENAPSTASGHSLPSGETAAQAQDAAHQGS